MTPARRSSASKRRRPASRKHAVALQYSSIDELPCIIARGAGELAKKIIQYALEHDIPVHEDMTLAEILSQLETGSPVSPETFRLVAEVVSFLYLMDREWREKHSFLAGTLPAAETQDKSQ